MRDVSLEDETIVSLPSFFKHLIRWRNDRICQTNLSKTKKRRCINNYKLISKTEKKKSENLIFKRKLWKLVYEICKVILHNEIIEQIEKAVICNSKIFYFEKTLLKIQIQKVIFRLVNAIQ